MNSAVVVAIALLAVIGIVAASLNEFIDSENADATIDSVAEAALLTVMALTNQIEAGSDLRTYTSYQRAVITAVLRTADDRVAKGEAVLKGRYLIAQQGVWEWVSKAGCAGTIATLNAKAGATIDRFTVMYRVQCDDVDDEDYYGVNEYAENPFEQEE